jgi:hypothetical protein
MFLYFVKVDQWDNSIQLMAFRHQNDKQIDSALQDWLNSKIALKWMKKRLLINQCKAGSNKQLKRLIIMS